MLEVVHYLMMSVNAITILSSGTTLAQPVMANPTAILLPRMPKTSAMLLPSKRNLWQAGLANLAAFGLVWFGLVWFGLVGH